MGIQAILDPIIAGIVGGGGEAAAGAGLAAGAGEAAAVGAPLAISDVGAGFLAGTLPEATAATAIEAAGAPALVEGGVLGSGAVADTEAAALAAGSGALGGAAAGVPTVGAAAGDLSGGLSAISPTAGGAAPSLAGATPDAAAGAGGSALTSPLSLSSSPLSSSLPSAGAAGSGTAPGSAIATAAPSGIAGGSTDITAGLPDITSQLPQGQFASLAGGGPSPGVLPGQDVAVGALDPAAPIPPTAPSSLTAFEQGAGSAAPAAGGGAGGGAAAPGFFQNLGTGNIAGAGGNLLTGIQNNPLAALGAAGIGANFLLGNKTPGLNAVKAQAQPAAINAANQAQIAAQDEGVAAAIAPNAIADRQSGELLQSYETSGLLPPGQRAALTQQQLAGEAAIRARAANQSSGGASSAATQDLASLGIQVAGQAATVAQGLWSQGTTMLQTALSETQQELSALGASESALASAGGEISNIAQIYETVMQAEVSQDAALGQSIANFSGAAAGMSARPAVNIYNTQPAAA
jgi:hypothetical protein